MAPRKRFETRKLFAPARNPLSVAAPRRAPAAKQKVPLSTAGHIFDKVGPAIADYITGEREKEDRVKMREILMAYRKGTPGEKKIIDLPESEIIKQYGDPAAKTEHGWIDPDETEEDQAMRAADARELAMPELDEQGRRFTQERLEGLAAARHVAGEGRLGRGSERMLETLMMDDMERARAKKDAELAHQRAIELKGVSSGTGGNAKYSNTPIWGTNEQGESILMQSSSAGGPLSVAELPPGVTARRGQISYQDLGDKIAIFDANGQFIGYREKGIDPVKTPTFKAAVKTAEATAATDAGIRKAYYEKGIKSQQALDALVGVENLINKSTGSWGGAAFNAVAAVFGYAPEGAINVGKLRVLQANLMLSQPRMEGPQSDKDVQLYREAAGQIGDPTVPNSIKLAAIETIRALHGKYAKGAPPAGKAPPPAPTAPSEEDIVFTMEKHNLTREQVMQRLGLN